MSLPTGRSQRCSERGTPFGTPFRCDHRDIVSFRTGAEQHRHHTGRSLAGHFRPARASACRSTRASSCIRTPRRAARTTSRARTTPRAARTSSCATRCTVRAVLAGLVPDHRHHPSSAPGSRGPCPAPRGGSAGFPVLFVGHDETPLVPSPPRGGVMTAMMSSGTDKIRRFPGGSPTDPARQSPLDPRRTQSHPSGLDPGGSGPALPGWIPSGSDPGKSWHIPAVPADPGES